MFRCLTDFSLMCPNIFPAKNTVLESVQFSSVAQSCPTLCDPMDCSTPGSLSITNSRSLLKLMSIELVMPSNRLILCRPFSSCPQSLSASGSFQMSQLSASGGQSFSFNISPSNEHPGLISFRMDWLDLLAVQGTLKSLLHITVQKHQFFSTQLSL